MVKRRRQAGRQRGRGGRSKREKEGAVEHLQIQCLSSIESHFSPPLSYGNAHSSSCESKGLPAGLLVPITLIYF